MIRARRSFFEQIWNNLGYSAAYCSLLVGSTHERVKANVAPEILKFLEKVDCAFRIKFGRILSNLRKVRLAVSKITLHITQTVRGGVFVCMSKANMKVWCASSSDSCIKSTKYWFRISGLSIERSTAKINTIVWCVLMSYNKLTVSDQVNSSSKWIKKWMFSFPDVVFLFIVCLTQNSMK